MRLLTPRRVAVTALCAALTLGTAGPAFAHSLSSAPTTAAQQSKAPQDIGDILGSVGSVIDAVLGTVSGAGGTQTQTLPAAATDQQMKDLAAAIEELRKAMAESGAATGTGTAAGTTAPAPVAPAPVAPAPVAPAPVSPAPVSPAPGEAADAPNAGAAAADEMDVPDTADPAAGTADMDKALAAMDKAIDNLVAAAVKGQGTASAAEVQAATQTLMDSIMRDVAQMTGTPATGMNTLPATTLPATTVPQSPTTGL
ncbi:hypothetical protein [Streptomyces sp. NPDC015131]|uniref:hypothetical protein n=1 Tax=Streptomyces sp. NPDC015131 TaxID=3364941 RepID=UPI0036F55B47